MNILLVMIPLSILFALGAGIAFFWAVDHDQFDDLETPGLLPLLDDPRADEPARGDGDEAVEQDDNLEDSSFRRKPETLFNSPEGWSSICFEGGEVKMDPGLRRDDVGEEPRVDPSSSEPRA